MNFPQDPSQISFFQLHPFDGPIPFEGLQILRHPPNFEIESEALILGAWRFGHVTLYDASGITPGHDWLAVVWRTDDEIKSFGRLRHHREYLEVEDDKDFYTSSEHRIEELLQIYSAVAEQLSTVWGVRPHKVFGIEGRRIVEWLSSLPNTQITIS
jgi:hypothetical protein